MPPTPFYQLSDEPLYCEAVHDKDGDDFYSGSEDDHYEGPLHRRLHIEKKAIDFLSGNVPILLSAALRGPFDRKQWNNPWRSTRAESHALPPRTQPTRWTQTAAPEEDLPDTQGTSLYPLPSPEITNPPSARKNPYMDEQDYSRIKNWRAAVKSTSVSKDPFWQSQRDDQDNNPPARKRSVDPTWLHKRDGKKRRSTNPRNSIPDDSPSRDAVRTKDGQTRQRNPSQMVAQFLRNSSPPEDELATSGRTRSPCSNTSPMANKNKRVPNLLRSGQATPHRRTRLRQAADTSEDELSMPATTPNSNVKRSSTMVSTSPTRDRSPSRRKKATKSKSRPLRGRDNSLIVGGKIEKPQLSQSSTSQRSVQDGARAGSQTVAVMVATAFDCMDGSPQELSTKPSEPFQDQILPDTTAKAKPLVPAQALAAPSTQQDNSFLFHKRARSPSGKLETGRSTGVPKNGAAPSPSSIQLCVTNTNERGDHLAPSGSPAITVIPGQTTIVKHDSHQGQDLPSEPAQNPIGPIGSPAADDCFSSSHNSRNLQTECVEGNQTYGGMKTTEDSPAKVEPDAANDLAELVRPLSTTKHKAFEEPRTLLQVDGCSPSDSEWSTYLDTQTRTSASCSVKDTVKKSNDIPVVEDGVDGLSDPEWSTYINTQDVTPIIGSLEASAEPEEILTDVAAHGPDIQVDSNNTTRANIESLPPVSPGQSVMAHEVGRTGFAIVSWPGLASQVGDAPEHSTPAEVSQDAEYSQASVGSIIDAYAEMSVLSTNSETTKTEMAGAEHREAEAELFPSSCLLPDQIATVPIDGSQVHDGGVSSGKSQQLQTTIQKPAATESSLASTCDPSKPIESTTRVEIQNAADLSDLPLQTPREPEETARCSVGPSFLDEPNAGPEIPQLQSPWTGEVGSSLQMPPQAPGHGTRPGSDSGGLNEAAAQVQSPWNTKADIASHLVAPPMNFPSLTRSTPDLSILAGKALAMSQPSQSPWGPQTPAAADFEMSIRAFSDFMSPSPVKKRASSARSTLRHSSARSGILFKTPGQRKPDRRVRFAPLPGEQESFITDPATDDKDAIYDEEDVSYFDLSGRKTGTVRMPKPTMRTASPPPLEMSSVEVGALPDHDQKFFKHFEAMSKRKKPSRKSLRLLPSESQQSTSSSQEVGAMAEAFIQASQTRKKGLELASEKRAGAECSFEHEDKTSAFVAMEIFEDQENVEPVDDVSAVLDNLDEFLDNTWGIEVGTDDPPVNDGWSKQEKKNAPSQHADRKVEDPLLSLEGNVWLD